MVNHQCSDDFADWGGNTREMEKTPNYDPIPSQ